MFSTGKTCKFRRTLYNRQLIQFVRIPAEFVARLNLVFSTANGVYVLWNLSTVSGPYFPGYQRFSSRAAGIFRCRPKPDTSSAVGRSHERRSESHKDRNRRPRQKSFCHPAAVGPHHHDPRFIYLFILLSSFFEPVLDPRFSIPILDPRSSILDPGFPVNFEVLLIKIILFFWTT